jgi:hypothetical protein
MAYHFFVDGRNDGEGGDLSHLHLRALGHGAVAEDAEVGVCGPACRNYRARPPVPKGENVKMIPLTNGFYAYVDADSYEWLNQWHWRAYSAGYVARWEKGRLIYMHRRIMQPRAGKIVDHINGNGYDNTRANMRNITRRENMHNKGRHVGTASTWARPRSTRGSGATGGPASGSRRSGRAIPARSRRCSMTRSRRRGRTIVWR